MTKAHRYFNVIELEHTPKEKSVCVRIRRKSLLLLLIYFRKNFVKLGLVARLLCYIGLMTTLNPMGICRGKEISLLDRKLHKIGFCYIEVQL